MNRTDDARSTAAIFTAGGATPKAGSRFFQPDLAGTLTCRYRQTLIVTAPLPSSGGVTMCEALGILAADAPARPVRSFENTHLEVEAERRAFVDRNMQLGDPAFAPSQVSRLLEPAYLARQRATIASERATASADLRSGLPLHEGTNTTNYSVVDAAGNAVDVTYTINNWFGSGFVAGNTGVLLNDEMDDFTSKPGVPNMMRVVQGTANKIEPGKRPLSSMTPTMVVDAGGRIELVTGAAGGPRIITTVLDIVRAVVDFGEGAGTALVEPRMHMQWLPDAIYAERDTLDEATLAVRLVAWSVLRR
jgi:gamma-glutamyltranspeptidase/glutathione hydrolase